MAQSGIFRHVLQDERFDNIFTASKLLHERLSNIRQQRSNAGFSNPRATFAELSESHIMYLHAVYRPYVNSVSEYVCIHPSGDAASLSDTGGNVEFTFPVYGHFTSDMVVRFRFNTIGPSNGLLYRYCAYPGIRLLQKVAFRSDETLIDDYTSDDVIFTNQFQIPADRRVAWDRGMGQSQSKSALFYNSNAFSEERLYRDGLQTPKITHFAHELWIPLQFWMCGDASNALLNDLIPNSQRTILLELAPLSKIIQAIDESTGFVVPLPIDEVGIQIELYVNNIFVSPDVHDLFASRMGFSLIRVHRRQKKMLTSSDGSVALDQLKFPAEYLFIGFRDLGHAYDFDQWHLFGQRQWRTPDDALSAALAFWNSSVSMYQIAAREGVAISSLEPIIRSMKLTAHGIDLWPQMSTEFFSSYAPQRYFNQTALIAAADRCAYFLSFCLYPGLYNPSGYYNLSAGRELYLSYKGSNVSPKRPAELIVSMSALNFLVRRGDKVSLRYAV